MGLAQARLAVDEQRVVVAVAVSHAFGRLQGDHVFLAHDKAVERELGVVDGNLCDQRVALASLRDRQGLAGRRL